MMAATNKSLAQSNKSLARGKATKKQDGQMKVSGFSFVRQTISQNYEAPGS
jgi:hypothetical protein